MSAIKPRTATLTIFQGDDLDELAHLRRKAEVARRRVESAKGAAGRIGDDIPSSEAEEAAYDAFVEAAAERAVTIRVEHIGSRRFRELVAAHPPREVERDGKTRTHPDDAPYDVNVETFAPALLTYDQDGRRTVVEPDLSGSALRDFLEDELAEGDYDELFETAYWLNRGRPDPKAGVYSTDSLNLPEI